MDDVAKIVIYNLVSFRKTGNNSPNPQWNDSVILADLSAQIDKSSTMKIEISNVKVIYRIAIYQEHVTV